MKIILPAAILLGVFAFTSCTKKTTTTTVVQDSVYYSAWTPIAMQVDLTDSLYAETFNNSKITAAVISRGAVLGFIGYPSGNGDTVALSIAEAAPEYYVEEILQPGSITLTTPYQPQYNCCDLSYGATSGYLYRYVIISGNVLANSSLSGLTQQQLQKMNFTDIQKAASTPRQTSSGSVFNP